MAQPEVREQYLFRLDALVNRADRLSQAEQKRLVRLINEARKQVRDLILSQPTDWTIVHYDGIRARLNRALAELARAMGLNLDTALDSRHELGLESIDELIGRFGNEGRLRELPFDRTTLGILEGLTTDLVTNVTQEVIDDISTQIQLGIAANKTPWQVMQDVGVALRGDQGIWPDLLTRTEMIQRTESNRVFALGQQQRLMQWNEQNPGLLKVWKHSGHPLNPRPSHVEAEERYAPGGSIGPIPVDRHFKLVAKASESKRHAGKSYLALYPRDPALPAFMSVACRCAMGPWRREWTE